MIIDSVTCFDFFFLIIMTDEYSQRVQLVTKRNLLGMVRSCLFVVSCVPLIWFVSRKKIRFLAILRVIVDTLIFGWSIASVYFPWGVLLLRETRQKDRGKEFENQKMMEFLSLEVGFFFDLICLLMLFYIYYERLIKLKMIGVKGFQESLNKESVLDYGSNN